MGDQNRKKYAVSIAQSSHYVDEDGDTQDVDNEFDMYTNLYDTEDERDKYLKRLTSYANLLDGIGDMAGAVDALRAVANHLKVKGGKIIMPNSVYIPDSVSLETGENELWEFADVIVYLADMLEE